MKRCFILMLIGWLVLPIVAQNRRIRDWGVKLGQLRPGEHNAITDVAGVKVGQVTLHRGEGVRTGVTAVVPYEGNLFRQKVPAAIHVANGFGKLMGISQVEELGNIETPIVLTNTLSVATAAQALIDHVFSFPENGDVRSVNAVVGETNDGYLNDIRGRQVTQRDVLEAIRQAKSGPVAEGCVGAGTGTVCLGFKGGIGTSSRVLPKKYGGYTVGVLVQSNFGGILRIDGVEVGVKLDRYYSPEKAYLEESDPSPDGSCMIVVATDAPLDSRNLKRLAKRAILGLAKVGGIVSNGSGDYVIAFSTAESLRVPFEPDGLLENRVLHNDQMSPLFLAVNEATEEALLNSLFMATTTTGVEGHKVEALPVETVLRLIGSGR